MSLERILKGCSKMKDYTVETSKQVWPTMKKFPTWCKNKNDNFWKRCEKMGARNSKGFLQYETLDRI